MVVAGNRAKVHWKSSNHLSNLLRPSESSFHGLLYNYLVLITELCVLYIHTHSQHKLQDTLNRKWAAKITKVNFTITLVLCYIKIQFHCLTYLYCIFNMIKQKKQLTKKPATE